MGDLSTEMDLIILCSIIILSYIFSIVSRYIKVPAVLLLLASGIALRYFADQRHWNFLMPRQVVEFLGTIGLIMIVLEAGLDLKLGENKIGLIRDSFFSAFFIFLLSAAGISFVLVYFLNEPIHNCIVYAIPLSIMSSAIVIPSLHQLSEHKKEFLIYEASFADIIGVMIFNFFVMNEVLSTNAFVGFFLQLMIAIVASFLFSILLFIILAKSKLNIKFFLIIALLICIYEAGKLLHLPSLIIIILFGLMMNNWELIQIPKIQRMFPIEKVKETTHFLHGITAETSFLIRTFFFIAFGFSINIQAVFDNEVILIGSIIVLILLLIRFLYLRFFLKESVYPEVVFIPRGLVTVLLFYKIPDLFRLKSFNEGILFFVVLITSLVMMIGMLFYKKQPQEMDEETLL
jgi:Kef-type K+ transport system membrane component KefB